MIREVPALRDQDGMPANKNLASARQLGTREILTVVIRRRWIILGILIPIVLMAFLATLNTTDSVTASTRVVIEARQPESTSFGNGSVDYDVLMSTASQVAISIPVADRAALALMDSLPDLKAEHLDFHEIETRGQMREYIMGHEDCNQVGETNILELSFSHPSARFALMAVGALTDAFISYTIERNQNKPAVAYYGDQIEQVKAGLDSLLERRTEILDEHGLIAFKENAQSNAAQIVEMERAYFNARADRESAETRLEAVRKAVAQDEMFLPPMTSAASQEFVVIKRMLDEEETKLTRLRQQYTDESTWVSRQDSVVAELRSKFIEQRDNYMAGLEIEIQTARRREFSLSSAVETQRSQITSFPEVSQKLRSVEFSIDTQMDLLELLQIKRGEVRLKAATDARVSSIVPLNAPAISGFVGGSQKVIYLSLATIFGLVLGLIAALFLDNQDHRIYDKYQLQDYLEIPVLGSISNVKEK